MFEQGARASTAQSVEIEDDIGADSQYASFLTNDELISYGDLDRESTTDSILVRLKSFKTCSGNLDGNYHNFAINGGLHHCSQLYLQYVEIY